MSSQKIIKQLRAPKRIHLKIINFLVILLVITAAPVSLASSVATRTFALSGAISQSSLTTYFECSFENTYPASGFDYNQNFPYAEPCAYPCEKGKWNWVNVRPTTITQEWQRNAGSIYLITDPSDATRTCARFILDAPGTRPLTTAQHTKLYEVQYTNRQNYVEPYPTLKEAYYQFKIWVPSSITIKQGTLLWQMCGDLNSYGTLPDADSPQLSLAFVSYGDPIPQTLMLTVSGFYYNDFVSGINTNRFFSIMPTADFPKDQWVTITIFAKQGTSYRAEDGTLTIWINSNKVFEKNTLPTASYSGTPYFTWGIGCYGSNKEMLNQNFLFKDVIVTSKYPT